MSGSRMAGTQLPVRSWAGFVPFDPGRGQVVREPPGRGSGFWAGAPGVTYDPQHECFYLVYRLRRPRGVEPDRGAEVRIARSRDGIRFDDIWSGHKRELESPSIERCALVPRPDGRWTLLVSFVDPADARWRIDRVEADGPDRFDLASRSPALTAAATATEGVKDPFLFSVAGLYHMIVSYAVADAYALPEQLHGTADAYNTGLIKSCTGLAVSQDGVSWHWEGAVLTPNGSGWDAYCRRIGTVWHQPPVWLALYDGSADVSQNYEEQCGLAFSFDLRRFHCVSRHRPLMVPPHGQGALRYFDVLALPDARYLYYEMARPDGSHDLRVFRME